MKINIFQILLGAEIPQLIPHFFIFFARHLRGFFGRRALENFAWGCLRGFLRSVQ